MDAGYSGKPLHRKLGLKEGFRVRVINAPGNYKELIGEVKLVYQPEGGGLDLIRLNIWCGILRWRWGSWM